MALECRAADCVRCTKQAIQSAPVLALPNDNLPFVVQTDASGFAVGAVLQQDQGDGLRPIAFLSKKLLDAETRYPTHEKELLAIVHALKAWRHYLYGKPIRVLTDHHSLQRFQTQPQLSARQARWKDTFAEFNLTIEYVEGKHNVVADALSRRPDHAPDQQPTLMLALVHSHSHSTPTRILALTSLLADVMEASRSSSHPQLTRLFGAEEIARGRVMTSPVQGRSHRTQQAIAPLPGGTSSR